MSQSEGFFLKKSHSPRDRLWLQWKFDGPTFAAKSTEVNCEAQQFPRWRNLEYFRISKFKQFHFLLVPARVSHIQGKGEKFRKIYLIAFISCICLLVLRSYILPKLCWNRKVCEHKNLARTHVHFNPCALVNHFTSCTNICNFVRVCLDWRIDTSRHMNIKSVHKATCAPRHFPLHQWRASPHV